MKNRHRVVAGLTALAWCGGLAAAIGARAPGPDALTPAPAHEIAAPTPTVPLNDVFQSPRNIPARTCADAKCHAAEDEWARKLDGGANGKQHINADDQLEASVYPAVTKYLGAVGLADAYAANGMCVTCHATVVQGDVDDGVTCQNCHGPGSLYNGPHQTVGRYDSDPAALVGMNLFLGKPDQWGPICTKCHVLTTQPVYQALLAAGHTSGDTFKVSDKYKIIQPHWKRSRQANFTSQLRAFDPAPAAAPRPAAAAKVDCAVSGFEGWTAWTRVDDQSDSRTRTRQVTTPPANGGAPCPDLEETETRARPAGPPAIDCQVSDWSDWSAWAGASASTESRTRSRTVARPPANGGRPCAALTETESRTVRRAGGGPPPPPPPPPPPDSDRDSVADHLDACPNTAQGTTVDATGCPLAPVTPTAAGTAPSAAPVTGVGGLQGRIIAFLDSLLRQGASRTVDVRDAPVSYSGPNAELLRLQQEVIGLALKALALPPRGSGTPPPGGGGGG